MNKIYTTILSIALLLVSGYSSLAQKNFFFDINEKSIPINNAKRTIIPQKFRTLSLDNNSMKNFLWSLPTEDQVRYNRGLASILELPMPDGSMAKFRVWESSIMEAGLEAKFPEMKTFAGQGMDDPYATIRFDYNPYFGFHAQVLSAVTGTYYIDPYVKGNIENYISYFKKDLQRNPGNYCETLGDAAKLLDPASQNIVPVGPCRGTQLYTYRLALACTGEYAVAVCSPLAATVPVTAAAMLTTVNRVNGVYELETSIRMVLIANNNILINLDGSTDPYTNNSGTAMLSQNQANIDALIGSDNYDIGHVVSTGGGGVASLRSPCNPSIKARGVTGLPNPVGDAFDIDFVAHEIGHQWGGNHPFNGVTGNCSGGNRNAGTAYEVGSGTTIQAYAGICGSDDIQPNSDPYFHSVSFDEISAFVEAGGAACRVVTATGNTLPQIISMSDNGVSIPISTPFTLNATASDVDGDAITYNWEQWDLGPATSWDGGNANTISPLFKSRIPKVTGSRTFPDIRVIVANYPANPGATMDGLKGETLPNSARTMKFRLTVRDNRLGGGAVVTGGEGCQTGFSVPFQVNTVGTTPFTVTVPNGGESWEGSTTQTITWNVASTNAAPFSVSNVKISLSTDGGLTYPTVLSASTANDGSEALTIPTTPTTTARIKVEAIGNIFFDISNANFTITIPTSGFDFTSPAATTIACNSATSATLTLGTSSIGGYVVPVALTATAGVPAGTTVSLNPAIVVPGNSSIVTLNNTNALASGTYNITITGISGVITKTRVISFIVSAGTAPSITTNPANTSVCVGSNAVFNVTTSGPAATGYQWQSSPDGVNYTNITGATAAAYTVTAVTTALNNYRYRVIVSGQCGSATSTAAILTVQTAPAITTQPADAVDCVGNNATFSVTATGTGLTYQWEFSTDGIAPYTTIAGANASSHIVTGVVLAQNNYRYRVIVSGTCPSPVTSNAATLFVGNAAAIATQPVSTTVCVSQTATFTIAATGSSLTYQWQQSIDGGANFTNIAGATAATLNLPSTVATQNGYQYRVNVFSCTPTPITSSVATLTVNTLIAINTQPTAFILCEGSNATFSVAAVGTGATYQWQVSTTGCAGTFTNIAGATTNTLAVNNTTASQNGNGYRVVVTGTCNNVTSSCVTLTVNTAIVVTSQPASISACLPTQTTASFSVAVTGTSPTYQWQQSINGGTTWTNITGETASTLTLNSLTASMTGNQYRVVLNGTCTSNLNSSAATLTVNTLVNITSQPVSTSICAGASTAFNVSATGSTITYQWEVSINGGPFVPLTNVAPYTGVTTPSLNIANAGTVLSGYRYRVIVAGVPCGSVTSNVATLAVNPLPSAVLVAAQNNRLTPYINSGLFTTVSPAGSYTYQWKKDGAIVAGATASSLPVNVDGFGEYDVTVTDANTGCSSTTNKVTISDAPSNMVFVYPNPSSGQFQVRYFRSTSADNAYSVAVFDSKGGKVFYKQFPIAAPYSRMDVDLRNATAGIYMLEVRDAKGKRLASSGVMIVR